MSFLVEDDAHATLQMVFAFIDACDDSIITTSSSSGSSPLSLSSNNWSPTTSDSDLCASSSPLLSNNESHSHNQQQQATQRSGDRTKGNVEAVRRLRAKKKAETVQLRKQVAQLEAQLQQLRSAHKNGSSLQVYLQRLRRGDRDQLLTANEKTKDENELLVAIAQPVNGSTPWLKIAAIQVQERLKSQALNAELKDAVGKQVKLFESIEAMLANKANQFVRHLIMFACGL